MVFGQFGKGSNYILDVTISQTIANALFEGDNSFFLFYLICMLHQPGIEGIQHVYSKGWKEFLFECLKQYKIRAEAGFARCQNVYYFLKRWLLLW